MKYFKILLLVITFSSVSNAYDLYRGKCIENYWWSGSNFYYYHKYKDTKNSSLINEPLADFDLTQLDTNHVYTIDYYSCKRDVSYFGLSITQFNFLLAFIGIIFGGVFMFFTVQAFTTVGGKR
jgi:hypothetical protein